MEVALALLFFELRHARLQSLIRHHAARPTPTTSVWPLQSTTPQRMKSNFPALFSCLFPLPSPSHLPPFVSKQWGRGAPAMARSRGGWAVAAAAAALVLQLANANTTSGNASAAAVNATTGSNTSAANPNASNASSAAVANASTTSNASSASAAGAASANTSNVTAAALDATAQSVSVLAKAASAACTSRDQVPGSCLNGSSARAEPEGVDLGPCVCDLTWQLCDANCQCDGEGRDCSSAELEVFSDEHGVPFKRERATVEVPLCFEQDTFLKLNSEMRLENSPLCVQRNNNPKTGRFFEPAVAVSNDKVRIEFARAGFGPWSDAKTFAQAYTAGQPYKVGMYIAIGRGSYANQAVQRFSRAEFLALPAPGANGHCQLGHMVKYWMPADSPPCVQGGDVQSVCAAGSVLAGDYLLKDLFVAKELPGTQAEWSEISKWKTVSVTAEVVTRSAMGEILSVKRVVAGSSVPAPSYDPVSKTCKNVLESLDLTLVMDGQGGIASVAALVRVSDAPTTAAGTGRNVYVTQKFSARFVDQQVFDAAGVSPIEQASFDKSGSPGYVDGLPLRAGLLANETSETPVIRLLRPGLTLPDMAGPDGMCKVCPTGATATTWGCSVVPAATAGYEANSALERLPVLFNQDVKLGCRLKLTKAQLDR